MRGARQYMSHMARTCESTSGAGTGFCHFTMFIGFADPGTIGAFIVAVFMAAWSFPSCRVLPKVSQASGISSCAGHRCFHLRLVRGAGNPPRYRATVQPWCVCVSLSLPPPFNSEIAAFGAAELSACSHCLLAPPCSPSRYESIARRSMRYRRPTFTWGISPLRTTAFMAVTVTLT